jgi:hypothetical protein
VHAARMRDTKDTQYLYTYLKSSVASTMNRCGLEGSGFEIRCRRQFTYPPRPDLMLIQPLVKRLWRPFTEGKAARACR